MKASIKRFAIGIPCISLALLFSVAFAKDAPKLELLIDTTYFVPARILPSPPAADSQLTQSEIGEVKTIVAAISAKERALAATDALDKTAGFFADTITGFDLKNLPATKSLFEQVRYTEDQQAKVFKNFFKRPRPYITDPSIKICVEAEQGGELASYPSGHATMAYSMGVVLAHLLPDRSSTVMERAKLYADNRLRCGVHHRSDIVAGQVLGTLVAVELLQNSTFQTMLAASREELRAAGILR